MFKKKIPVLPFPIFIGLFLGTLMNRCWVMGIHNKELGYGEYGSVLYYGLNMSLKIHVRNVSFSTTVFAGISYRR